MVLIPLPSEHIYSYLYRCYRVHGVNAMKTIIDDTGRFKQRLALIDYKHVESFVPDIPDEPISGPMLGEPKELRYKYRWWNLLLFPVMERSGFDIGGLFGPKSNAVLSGQVRTPGLKVGAKRVNCPEEIKYCPCCVRDFIYNYGTAYLIADWLGPSAVCKEHGIELSIVNAKSRSEATVSLERIFLGEVTSTPNVSAEVCAPVQCELLAS
ncbi:TniQ family protein [Aeromonas caviae]|uniref:TniQ family protein n=1 Tax=Aeromonas caviae TaxID=648 RepID=UPI0020B8279A|nr:TniQ family protein [Aeromonas caviae]UTI02701.1 TniQ family protein [Aeromonas caviae]